MLRLIVCHIACIDVMAQVGRNLIVVHISLVEEVAEHGIGRTKFTGQCDGILLAHLIVDVDVGVLGVVLLAWLNLAARCIVGQLERILAHAVHVIA